MSKRRYQHQAMIPANYARVVFDLGRKWGMRDADIVAGTRIHPQSLEQPEQRLNNRDAARISLNVLNGTQRRELGFELGFQFKPTTHGFIGYAVMSSANIREVGELIFKFLRVRLSDIRLIPAMDGNTLTITATDRVDFGPLRPVLYEAIFTITYTHLEFLLGRPPSGIEFCFDWPEPAYFKQYQDRLPNIRWSAGVNQARMDPGLLYQPIVTADPLAALQAVSVARDELTRMGGTPKNVVAQVRAELRPGPCGYPNLETVADHLHMSISTLKRRLQAQGTRFQALLDDIRHHDALHMMRNANMSFNEISLLLGFSDPASFTRAFRRWTGETPSQRRGKQA